MDSILIEGAHKWSFLMLIIFQVLVAATRRLEDLSAIRSKMNEIIEVGTSIKILTSQL